LKIGQHLAKLEIQLQWHLFFRTWCRSGHRSKCMCTQYWYDMMRWQNRILDTLLLEFTI